MKSSVARVAIAVALSIGGFVTPSYAQTPSWAPAGWTPAGSPDGGGTEPWYVTKAAALVAQMTDSEKIQQLSSGAPAISRLGINAYSYWSEALHGINYIGGVTPVGFTVFPDPIALGATWDPDLVEKIASGIADEGRGSSASKGTSLVFWAPVINMLRDPRWGRFDESYGEDPYHMGQIANGYIIGLQGKDPKYLKAVAVVKHFAGYNQEDGRLSMNAVIDERNLREYYTPQFRSVVTQGHVSGIMASYNAINGVPSTANSLLLWNLLRQEWGFGGFVVGDCNAIARIAVAHHYASSNEQAVALALLAGSDLDCGSAFRSGLAGAQSNGWISSKDLDRAVTRVLSMRVRLGEFDPKASAPYASIDASAIHSQANQQLALQAARESITLLKNDGTLPLSKAIKSIALIGPHADDAYFGNYSGSSNSSVTAKQGLQQMFAAGGPTINYQQGCTISGPKDTTMFAAATTAAASSEVAIVVLGTDNTVMAEGKDRADWNLPGVQLDLLKAVVAANPKTILVLAAGANLGVDWAQSNVPAILCSWHNGEAQGKALAETLFGVANPAGRVSTTWYSSTASIPPMADYDVRKGRTYMYYTGKPIYPFGHGLSYTKFTYKNLTVAPSVIGTSGQATVTFELTNSGSVAGDEVVQVYVHDNASAVARPIKALRAFKRINLAAGQKTTVNLLIAAEDLALWDSASQAWVVSKGQYDVFVGASSEDTRLTGSFVVDYGTDGGIDAAVADTGADASMDAGSAGGGGGASSSGGGGAGADAGTTTGSGCSCVVGAGSSPRHRGLAILFAVGAMLARRRARRPQTGG